jgi:hypothetical protein
VSTRRGLPFGLVDSSRSRVLVLDESLRRNVIAVAGYVATANRLVEIADSWRSLKSETFGVDPSLELKYTIEKGHSSRGPLDAAGWTQAERVPAMLDRIAGMGVLVLADVLVDVRLDIRPEQLYLDGLKWCLRRVANEVGSDTDGPHWAIVDMPPQAGELDAEGVSDRLRRLHEHVGTAAFDLYRRLWLQPEGFGPAGFGFLGTQGPPLRDLGFAPTLVAAHARHSDLLQIADVVAGCVRDFVSRCIEGAQERDELPPPGYPEDNIERIGRSFRRGYRRVCGYGFDVFPPGAPARDAIRQRLEDVCGA